MNTPKTLIGLMAIGLVLGAGTALAVEGSLGGTYSTGVDANAHADYGGVLDAVDQAKGTAEQTATAEIDATASMAAGDAAQAQATSSKEADASVQASADAKQGVLDGIAGNLQAFGGWAQSIFVKPTVDAKHAEDMTASGALVSQVANHDGSLDAYYGQDLQSTARVDYNVPPPPTPSVGFLGELKMAFEGIFHLG
jgi:hypothetical protein